MSDTVKGPLVIEFEELQFHKQLLGRGGYAEVHRAMWAGQAVAVKMLRRCKNSLHDRQLLASEIQVWQRFAPHASVVRLLGWGQHVEGSWSTPFAVMEWAQRGSLFGLLHCSTEPLSFEQKLALAKGAVTGVLHLHRRGILHADLSSRNFLVQEECWIKVADFGLSRTQGEDGSFEVTTPGTRAYASPEQLQASKERPRHVGLSSDVYGLGTLLWEIFTRRQTPVLRQAQGSMLSAQEPAALQLLGDISPQLPAALSHLVAACWRPCADLRPTCQEVLQALHSFGGLQVMLEARTPGCQGLEGVISLEQEAGELFDKGLYAEAALKYSQLVELQQDQLGHQHPTTISSVTCLAACQYRMGFWQAAEPLFRQACEALQGTLGPGDLAIIRSISNLAACLDSMGQHAGAQQLFQEAVGLCWGDTQLELKASLLHNQAGCLCSLGQFTAAVARCSEALQLRQELLGAEHEDTWSSLRMRAAILWHMGQFAEAEPLFRQLVGHAKQGHNQEQYADALWDLGDCLSKQRRSTEAEGLYRQAARLTTCRSQPAHTGPSNAAHQFRSWEQRLREMTEGLRRALGPKHLTTIAYVAALGRCLYRTGRYGEAAALCYEAQQARQDQPSPAHSTSADALVDYVSCQHGLGQHVTAVNLQQAAAWLWPHQAKFDVVGGAYSMEAAMTRALYSKLRDAEEAATYQGNLRLTQTKRWDIMATLPV